MLVPHSKFEDGPEPRTTITIRQRLEMRTLRLAGKRLCEIAKLTGIDRNNVRYHTRDIPFSRITITERVGKLAEHGLSNAEIRERLGLSINSVKVAKSRWRRAKLAGKLPRPAS